MQDRLLRAGPVREDDELALHLRAGARRPQRQDGVARDADRPHAVLRLPAARPRLHLRVHDEVPALHGARPGLLPDHAQARAPGRRRRRVRRRQPGAAARREHRELAGPARESRRSGHRSAHDAARDAVQQAGPAARADPSGRAVGRDQLSRRARVCRRRAARPGVFETLRGISELVLRRLSTGGSAAAAATK